MMSINENTSTRVHPRKNVNFSAQCRLGDSFFVGSILDISAGGAFFAPEAGMDGGWFVGLTNPYDFVSVDETLHIVVEEQNIHLEGKVRWVGRHRQHECHGFGIEFVCALSPSYPIL